MFHDFCDGERHVVKLTEILRQASESPIPHAAAAIREGQVPELPRYNGLRPGIFLALKEDLEAVDDIHSRMLTHYGVGDVLFVCARNRTVNQVNKRMQQKRLSNHPDLPEIRLAHRPSLKTKAS